MKKSWPVFTVLLCLAVESLTGATAARADGAEDLDRLMNAPRSAPAVVSATTSANQPAQVADGTGIIRLTPDRTHVLRLDQDAASVVVTNPAHATIALDSPRLLVIMPRMPGATSFTVLNAKGETVMTRDIIVSGAARQYVRVRKSCTTDDPTCVSNSYFYCPDGCYEVNPVAPSEGAGDVPPIAGANMPPVDTNPVMQPGYVPPNARSRSEPPPLPVMEDATGLSMDEELDPTDNLDEEAP